MKGDLYSVAGVGGGGNLNLAKKSFKNEGRQNQDFFKQTKPEKIHYQQIAQEEILKESL